MKPVSKYGQCHVCRNSDRLWPHHVEHRAYSDKVIRVCWGCHQKIHHDPQWAYNNGYLEKHNKSYEIKMKKVAKKSCNHSKTFFNKMLGYNKCHFCGKKVEEMNFISKTSKKSTKPSIAIEDLLKDSRLKKASEIV